MCDQAMITGNQPDNVGSCLPFLCQELWVMHHLLQEANYPHLQLCVQLKVLKTHTGTTTESLQRCCFFPCKDTGEIETTKRRKEEGELYLRVFGDPVTQHIQDPVRGGSSDNKLFVPIPLVCRETWKQV